MKADEAVLRTLLEHGGEFTWDKEFYRKKGPPIQSLKRLAEKGFVEVETRTCSPWNFGPHEGPWAVAAKLPAGQREAERKIRMQWHKDHPTTLKGRSEVFARITFMGSEEAEALGLLD